MASKTPLGKSNYSYHFNVLMFFGAWPLETRSKTKKRLYMYYQYIVLLFAAGLICSFLQDLCVVFGDLSKMSWNLCVITVFTGAIIKSLLVVPKSDVINELRQRLHEDVESRDRPEDLATENFIVCWMKRARIAYYAFIIFFSILFFVSRYTSKYSDEKLLPIPLYVPEGIDVNVGIHFDIVFIVFTMITMWSLFFIIEQELAMFTLLLQIKREYDVFLKNIPKLLKMRPYQVGVVSAGVKNSKARNFIIDIYVRQQSIMQYVQMFEQSYKNGLIIQVIFTTVLSVAIGVQCIVLPMNALAELIHRVVYLGVVLTEIYLLCVIGTMLNSHRQEVGEALYETAWYSMNASSRKDLSLMILFSQRSRKITLTKTMVNDLVTFMTIIKTIYSWLTLFRQFALKTKN